MNTAKVVDELNEHGEVQEKIEIIEDQEVTEELQDGTERISIETGVGEEFEEEEEKMEIIENGELEIVQIMKDESVIDEAELDVKKLEDEELEKLKELYRKNTGKRPMYAGKETKDFSQWLEELVAESQEFVEELKAQEEQEEWQEILRKWIEEATEEELRTELKEILKEILHKHEFYEEIRKIIPEFKRLNEKLANGDISIDEVKKLILISEKIKNTDLIPLNLNENIRNFKTYYQENLFDFLTERVWGFQEIDKLKERFMTHLSNKFKKMTTLLKIQSDVQNNIDEEFIIEKSDFNFQGVQLRRSRKILSLFFYELLNRSELNLPNLTQHLEKFDKKELILRLKDIFTGKEKCLTQKENQLIEILTENEVKTYNNMSINYFKTFYKYISDLFCIVSLMIISNKTHKIIGADFISLPFVRYLMNEKKINLFQKEEVLHREIREIYDFLKDSESKQDFPARRKKVSTGETYWSRISSSEYSYIIGSRIKIFVSTHIYNGKYNDNGIAKCLVCQKEKKSFNLSFPKIRAISFHHQKDKIEKYNSENLSKLFYKNRGNPYFLSELINQMESESIELKCRCHHRLIHSQSFFAFKKLISWENIYSKKFPYKDIFDLPAEIIHALVKLCVDNYHKTKSKTNSEKKGWIDDIIINLKKRYLIDLLYHGVCPICGEFNTRDHLPAFDFNHLHKKSELTKEERRKRKKINDLLFIACSKFIKEMEEKYNKGAFICCNDHMVIHETYSNEIFDDKVFNKEISKHHQDTIERFKNNLINNLKNRNIIEDPLKIVRNKRGPFLEFLMAIFEIMEEKGEVTTSDLMNRLKISKSTINYHFNKKQGILNTYGKLTIGKSNTPSKYYLNDKGWQLMHLFYFFRDIYRDLRN